MASWIPQGALTLNCPITMSIRKFTNPIEVDLSVGLQQLLYNNGMQAHIAINEKEQYELIVLGHDSPIKKYPISEKQVEELMGWGSNFLNKRAYSTFTNLVKNDFYMPDNYVSANNTNGKVITGLHGYRIGHGEYGYRRTGLPFYRPFHRMGRGWGGDFLGWSPRQQPGWHMRRIGGGLYMGHDPFVPERPDGRMKPGEMRSGGYGFYYRGRNTDATEQDLLDRPFEEIKIQPIESKPRPTEEATPLDEKGVYFSINNFPKVLESHGIAIDQDKKRITIQSAAEKIDITYSLTEDQLKKILSDSIQHVSIQDRLDIINKIIEVDYSDKITKDMLETKELISINLKPEVREQEEVELKRQEEIAAAQERMKQQRQELQDAKNEELKRLNEESRRIALDPNAINGKEIKSILGDYGFFNGKNHGRPVVVGEIRVLQNDQKDYIMTAEINGYQVSHAISKNDYTNFIDLDDEHRLKLFDHVFKEVSIRRDDYAMDMTEKPIIMVNGKAVSREEVDINISNSDEVNGQELRDMNAKKGFYREIDNGREVEVGNIYVEQMEDGKYRMTAEIEGENISHDISKREYDKFLAVDDYHRLKLFSKIFPEVDMKTRPGMETNVGAALLAALVVGTDVIHDVTHILHGGHHEPFMTPAPTIYAKEGVVSPGEIIARDFETNIAMAIGDVDDNIKRGI